ncbi:hypothetical protein D3C80_1255770 [compost metagenome]
MNMLRGVNDGVETAVLKLHAAPSVVEYARLEPNEYRRMIVSLSLMRTRWYVETVVPETDDPPGYVQVVPKSVVR